MRRLTSSLTILASGSAALIYWAASRYTVLLEKGEPWMELFWFGSGAVMLSGLVCVAVLCR